MKLATIIGVGAFCLAGSAFALEVTENTVLSADTDWREQGEVTVAAGATLDLAGHRFSLSAIAGSGTITDSVGGGVLYMDVPRGVSVVNTNVLFAGKLRFVKQGDGAFRQERGAHTYEGGTLVAAGALCAKKQHANNESALNFGKKGTEIRVERWASLELLETYNLCYWNYVLNGGTMKLNDHQSKQWEHAQVQNLTLLADSYVWAKNSGFIGSGYGVVTINLNGHELSIYGDGGNLVYFINTYYPTSGTLRFTNGTNGYFWMTTRSNDASNIRIINPGTSRFDIATTVKDFEGAKCDSRKAMLTVLGRFKSTGATIPNVTLANGATLDLTAKTGAWDPAGAGGSVAFASGATVAVDLYGRTDLDNIIAGDGYVFKWSSAPNATLVPDAATATAYMLVPDAAGLKIARRADIAKTAVWTGAANDGDWSNSANWTCTDFDDQPLTATPGMLTAVTFGGTTLPAVPASQAGCGNISGTVNLVGDLDWRGLDRAIFANGLTLDLRGHKLTLRTLRGVTAASATITDTVGGGELHLDVPEGEELPGDKVRLAGALKVVKEGTGTYTPSLINQTYTGGTDVKAGKVKFSSNNNNSILGNASGPVRIETGAIVDMNHVADMLRPFILAGGEYVNFGSDWGIGTSQLNNLVLEADASVENIDFISPGYAAAAINLGGHTLSLMDNNSANYLCNLTATNGTIYKKNGVLYVDKTKFYAPTVTLELDCTLQAQVNMDVGDLIMRYPGTSAPGTGTVSIHGTYFPYSNYIHNYLLLDGSAIDLSMRSEPFNMTSATTGKSLAVAANAKVTVKLGERELTKGEKIIAWDANGKPPVSVEFLPEEPLKERWKYSSRDDGLYAVYKPLMVIYVR